MSAHKKDLLILFFVIFSFFIIVYLFKWHSFNEYKNSYRNGYKVEQVESLMRTQKYVRYIKKARYSYSDKNTDKGLSEIEINPKSQLELVKPHSGEFHVYVKIKNNGKIILADLNFNRNGEFLEASYNWIDEKNINHDVTIPKSDERRLVKQVRKAVDKFLDTMYKEIYG